MIPTSNHNSRFAALVGVHVVYLLIPTSNHNLTPSSGNAGSVVYLLIPTSNHNFRPKIYWFSSLYIFWFLHQTTTHTWKRKWLKCCISFDSYIKPQPRRNLWRCSSSCISFDSYIKPQLLFVHLKNSCVVYLLIPTSNHNSYNRWSTDQWVVYLLIPTSNHN